MRIREALRAAVHDPDVGAVLVVYVPPVEASADDEIRSALRSCTECDDAHPPVVAVMAHQPTAGEPGDVPVFVDIESAVQAIADARAIARWRAADALRTDRETAEDEWPEPDVPAGPVVLDGVAALHLVALVGRHTPVLDLDSSGVVGCDIRLVDDPLFGMVLVIGVDDPVAEALDDRAHRLAPVSTAGAQRHAGVARCRVGADPRHARPRRRTEGAGRGHQRRQPPAPARTRRDGCRAASRHRVPRRGGRLDPGGDLGNGVGGRRDRGTRSPEAVTHERR